jgi:hypothetical protein
MNSQLFTWILSVVTGSLFFILILSRIITKSSFITKSFYYSSNIALLVTVVAYLAIYQNDNTLKTVAFDDFLDFNPSSTALFSSSGTKGASSRSSSGSIYDKSSSGSVNDKSSSGLTISQSYSASTNRHSSSILSNSASDNRQSSSVLSDSASNNRQSSSALSDSASSMSLTNNHGSGSSGTNSVSSSPKNDGQSSMIITNSYTGNVVFSSTGNSFISSLPFISSNQNIIQSSCILKPYSRFQYTTDQLINQIKQELFSSLSIPYKKIIVSSVTDTIFVRIDLVFNTTSQATQFAYDMHRVWPFLNQGGSITFWERQFYLQCQVYSTDFTCDIDLCNSPTTCPETQCPYYGCVSLNANPFHCGQCGNICSNNQTCSLGKCIPYDCVSYNGPYGNCYTPIQCPTLKMADCNLDPSDGCESTLGTNDRCSMCMDKCSLPNANTICDNNNSTSPTNFRCKIQSCKDGWSNCDGDVSNGCETSINTIFNCGGCGTICPSLPNTFIPSCSNGVCKSGLCQSGWSDCDGISSNGCETFLGTTENCAICANKCNVSNAITKCELSTCKIAYCDFGFKNCDGLYSTGCDINILTNLSHCGQCGKSCSSLPNVFSTHCQNGMCMIDQCKLGYLDCDSNTNNGCETLSTDPLNCGSCGRSCIHSYGVKNSTCSTTDLSCNIQSCNDGLGNCDGNSINGCETSLLWDSSNCGKCGTLCSSSQVCFNGQCKEQTCTVSNKVDCDGSGKCLVTLGTETNCRYCNDSCLTNHVYSALCQPTNGGCKISQCESGWTDCDSITSNGCEVRTHTSINNCGQCGNQCNFKNAISQCVLGTCKIGDCLQGFLNCDGEDSNGCEAIVDKTRCGSCTKFCSFQNANAECFNNTCSLSSCKPNFGDCNSQASDGCETSLLTSMSHCGQCGKTCSLPNAQSTCNNGNCMIDQCNQGWTNPNNIDSDGCELQINTDTDCSSKGDNCLTKFPNAQGQCSNGQCQLTKCNSNWGNCDTLTTNGCESNLLTSALSCGKCNTPCSLANANSQCQEGVCSILSCVTGWGNCDGIDSNGCERQLGTINDCNSCNNACNFPNAVSKCTQTSTTTYKCEIKTCQIGYQDCNPFVNNGCETNVLTDASNCGTCGAQCGLLFPNQISSCSNGVCKTIDCPAGYILQNDICVCNDCSCGSIISCTLPENAESASCSISGQCQYACKTGYTWRNNKCECISCSCGIPDSCPIVANSDSSICVSGSCQPKCKSGFSLVNGVCICSSCPCSDPNYIRVDGICQCNSCACGSSTSCSLPQPGGSTAFCQSGSCSFTCKPGYIVSGSTCQCNDCSCGSSSNCQLTTGASTMGCLSTDSNSCVATSCQSGYTLINGVCICKSCSCGSPSNCPVPANSLNIFCTGSTCSFDCRATDGYVAQGSVCACNDCRCGSTYQCVLAANALSMKCVSVGSTACVIDQCKPDFTLTNGICQSNSCPTGYVRSGTQCVCNSCSCGSSSSCILPPNAASASCAGSLCQYTCDPNYQYNTNSQLCECKSCACGSTSSCTITSGAVSMGCSASSCVATGCQIGYNLENGVCVCRSCSCGSSSGCTLSSFSSSMGCSGTNCVSISCQSGYILSGGTCICGSCSCGSSLGCSLASNALSMTCSGSDCIISSCVSGYILYNGVCQCLNCPCQFGYVRDSTGTCVCNSCSCGSSSSCTLPSNALSVGCSGGSCVATCQSGYTFSNGQCVCISCSCGSSSNCPLPANGLSTYCQGSTCAFTCSSGYSVSGTSCLCSSCSCGSTSGCYSPPNSASVYCQNGQCKFTCQSGYQINSAGTGCDCVNCLCGSTSNCLRPANALSVTCFNGNCQYNCPSGYTFDGTNCICKTCACGYNDCPNGDSLATVACIGGLCVKTCISPYVQDSSGKCVCNSCACGVNNCPGAANGVGVCSGGSCIIQCNSGYQLIGGQCVCRDCSCGYDNCISTAPSISTCISNQCKVTSCQPGYTLSGGSCICSSCEICGAQTCNGISNGVVQCKNQACDITCNIGYSLIGGICACTDCLCGSTASCTFSDPNGYAVCNFGGGCYLQCNTGYMLSNGVCVLDNPCYTDWCNGVCVDTISDINNCGSCGRKCGYNQYCACGGDVCWSNNWYDRYYYACP